MSEMLSTTNHTRIQSKGLDEDKLMLSPCNRGPGGQVEWLLMIGGYKEIFGPRFVPVSHKTPLS